MSGPLQAVLDTNVVVSISRLPSVPPNDKLTAAIEQRRLQVCVDANGGILGEWEDREARRRAAAHHPLAAIQRVEARGSRRGAAS